MGGRGEGGETWWVLLQKGWRLGGCHWIKRGWDSCEFLGASRWRARAGEHTGRWGQRHRGGGQQACQGGSSPRSERVRGQRGGRGGERPWPSRRCRNWGCCWCSH